MAMTTAGGSGSNMEVGEDFVAARLSIDIPTEGIASMRELTQEIERYRVGAEAAARAQDNFVRYLTESAEAAERAAGAQQNLLGQMERVVELQQRMASGGAGGGDTTVPQGYVDPFSGAQSGVGRGEVQGQIDALREQDPRTYLNMQAARGNLRPGDVPAGSPDENQLHESAARVHDREQQNTRRQQENPAAGPAPRDGLGLAGLGAMGGGMGMAGQVLNEMSPGGSFPGMAGLAANAMSRVGSAAAGSGLMRGLGAAGLGMTGALAANGLFQNTGELIQGYANQGSVRGGGAIEGIAQEASIRSLAMNPFISTEQSRQIIQSALTEGYTGKTFDSVTQFMAHNFKEMNMSVAESTELLRKNVDEGGQSIAGLAANLGILKEMSTDGNKSFDQLKAEFQGTSANLINAGFSGGSAERAAMVSAAMFNGPDDRGIKDIGTQITNAFASGRGMAYMHGMGGTNLPKGLMPGAMPFAMDGDQMAKASQEVVIKRAKQIHQGGGSPPQGSTEALNNAYKFDLFLKSMGVNVTPQESRQYYEKIVYDGRDPYGEAAQKADERTQEQLSVKSRNPLSAAGGGTVSRIAAEGSNFKDAAATTGTALGDLFTRNWSDIPSRFGDLTKRMQERQDGASDAASRYSIPMMESVMREHGRNGVEILDANGKTVKYNPNSKSMMDKLSSGEYTYRPKGSDGRGVSLSETPQNPTRDNIANVQGTLRIEMDPSAARAGVRVPSTVRLTPHEQKANAGYGGATPNNAPPGESPITRGR